MTTRVALCQLAVGADKVANIQRATAAIAKAAQTTKAAGLIVLPECFNCPYGTKYFADYAEAIPDVGASCITAAASPTVAAIGATAAAEKVWVVAGSIPERDLAGNLFNTSMTVGPDGVLRGRHRKMHLFKIDTETVKVDESEVLTAGSEPTVVQTDTLKLGVGICFDVRYPQLALHYAAQGTNCLVYPSAFNMVTGPKHWELCARSRAVDTQQYVLMCSLARDESAEYVAYGHSLVVDPWGEVIATAGGGEETTVFADIDAAGLGTARRKLPISAGTRHDLYTLQWATATANE